MARALSGLIVGGAALLAAAPALAQEQTAPDRSLFARDRNLSVSERPHPGYDPVPVRLGAFSAQPRLDGGVELNDNIYAAQTSKTSDAIFTVNPLLGVSSNWSRHAVQAYARSATRAYTRRTGESTTDYQVGGSGRLDVGHGQLGAGGDTGLFTEPRSSTNTARAASRPIRYQQSNAFATGVQEFNRFRVTGRFDLADLDYRNGVDVTGARVFQDDRDRAIYTYSGKGEYAVSPDTSLFVNGSFNEHRYRLTPPNAAINRNSRGTQINVGASFDLTRVVRGEVQVGYLDQDFDARQFSNISGLSALGRVEWFPTQLTTVTLTGSRQIQDAAVAGSAAYIAELVSLQADHELLRNVILTGRVGYENDAYRGVDRKDRQTTAFLGARYMMNRLVGFSLGWSFLDQKSAGASAGPRYTVNRVTLSTTLQF